MHAVTTVIYTDQLDAIRAFYTTHFAKMPQGSDAPDRFSIRPNSEAHVLWIDAKTAGMPLTQGLTVRFHHPFTEVERAILVGAGVACDDLHEEQWGARHGNVRCFGFTDPSNTYVVQYEDHYGEAQQLMTTGDGRGTREAHLE
jgi:hypothetical protein